DSGTASDSSTPTDSGTPTDSATADTGTPTDSGRPFCDVVGQDCPGTMQCVVGFTATPPFPACAESTGDLALGEECTSGPECAEGLDCLLNACLQYCRVNADCPTDSGLTCDRTITGVADFGLCND
ncbi:MAG: hypothetical protein DRJ42_27580, partial [Deltaproteobacteria bacterium]